MVSICINDVLDTFSLTAKEGLQLFIRNAIQNVSHNLKNPDLIGDLLTNYGAYGAYGAFILPNR
jgi:hypothetical protein